MNAKPVAAGDRTRPSGSAPPTEVDFGWALRTLSRFFSMWAAAAVEDLPGGPRGYLVLDAVARGVHSSQLAIARHIGLDKTAMTYLLDELEAAKLLGRRPDPSDRRARLLALTAKGERTLGRSRERVARAQERLLSALTPSEARQFEAMLERIALGAIENPDEASTDGCAT